MEARPWQQLPRKYFFHLKYLLHRDSKHKARIQLESFLLWPWPLAEVPSGYLSHTILALLAYVIKPGWPHVSLLTRVTRCLTSLFSRSLLFFYFFPSPCFSYCPLSFFFCFIPFFFLELSTSHNVTFPRRFYVHSE